jgi:hypothetical protein
MRLEGLGVLTKFMHSIGSRTRDLPACSIAPQPLRYRVFQTIEMKVTERNLYIWIN